MEERRERIGRGWVTVWCRPDGVWGVSFEPDRGDPEYPGVTYTAADDLRPHDFPRGYDVDGLMSWAKSRWCEPVLRR